MVRSWFPGNVWPLLPGESRSSSFPEGISHQMIGWLNGWSLFSKAEKNWVHHPSRLASYKAVLIFRNAIMSQWWELNLTKKNFAQEKVHWCSKGQAVLFILVQIYVQRPQLYKVVQYTAYALVLFLQCGSLMYRQLPRRRKLPSDADIHSLLKILNMQYCIINGSR